jgi:hypothetical protein
MFVGAKAVNHLSKTRGRGVWVPAFAGTTNLDHPSATFVFERSACARISAIVRLSAAGLGSGRTAARLGHGAGKGSENHAPGPAITLFSGRR